MKKLYSLTLLILCSYLSFAQTKGLIYKPASTPEGRAVLDPNRDGYTSKTTAGFINNDRGDGESEIAYKPLPVLEVEPNQDVLRGSGCGFTDIVDSGTGDPVMIYFDGTNFLVRFRLNKTSPNSKGYSILIDTDEKFGFNGAGSDPDAVAGNPGFELELVLMTNHSIGLYNVNGTTTPSLIVSKEYDSHSQKSVAYTEACGDQDYFYDFYIPWADFGLPLDTKLRIAGLSVMSPHPAVGNNAKSDVGGVDDRTYAGNYDKLFEDLIRGFSSTAPTDINTGIKAKTLCPSIDTSIEVTSTSITGTSSEAAGTIITVYKNNVALDNHAMVTSEGTWSLAVSGLAEGDIITVTALASGKEESERNCNGVLVGQVCAKPEQPTLTGSSGNSNKYITITVAATGLLDLYLGDQVLVSKASVVAGTTYYFCPAAAGLTTKSNSCSGGNNLEAGVYRATLTVAGCTSNSAFLCVNTTAVSATPVINSPITTLSNIITGTAPADAQVILLINGVVVARLRADNTGNWSVPTASFNLQDNDKVSAYSLEAGKCQSAETALITVVMPTTIAPVITGTYCGSASIVTGTSSEAAGTIISLFTGGSTPVASTTSDADGNWQISGLLVLPGTQLTATATATGKHESAASAPVAVKAESSNTDIFINGTTDPVTSETYILEDALSISGTGPAGGGLVSLYINEMLIGSGTLAGGVWTVKKEDFPYDFYLLSGAELTATLTVTGGCESDHTAPTVTIRCAPPAEKDITPGSLTLCSGALPEVTIKESEAFIIYQLYNGSTPISTSVLGTGEDLVLKATSPLTATEPNTVVNLRVVASKMAYMPGGSCEQTLAKQVTVTLNPEIAGNTISLSEAEPQFCGATSIGEITGSTPAGGDGSYTYLWQSSTDGATWIDIAEATEKNYSPGLVSATSYFRRMVFSGACSNVDASASVQITILVAVDNTITYSGQTSFCESGEPDEIQGNTDASFVSYKWQSSLDGESFRLIDGATAADYTPGDLTQTTTFRRVVNNGTCDSYSTAVTIHVYQPIANNTLSAPGSVILCGTANIDEIVGSTPTGGDGAYAYKWQKSTNNSVSFSDITGATEQNYTPGEVSVTTYFRRIAESVTCATSVSDAVKITVISAAETTITAAESSLAADGTSSTTIRVQLKDTFGDDVATDACTIELASDKGTLADMVYVGDGLYTAILTSETTAGTATVTGTLNSNSISDDAAVEFVPALNLAATAVTASPAVLYANGSSTSVVTVAFKDYASIGIEVDATILEILFNHTAVAFESKGGGIYQATVPARTTAEVVQVTARYDGVLLSSSATVEFIPVPVLSLDLSTVVANPTTVIADGVSVSLISVQLKDTDGNDFDAGETVSISSNFGTTDSFTSQGNGNYTATLSSKVTGTATITARVGAEELATRPEVYFVAGSASNTTSTIQASEPSIPADGVSTSVITVTLFDAQQNRITAGGSNVVLSTTLGTLGAVADHNDGTYSAILTSGTISGTAVISGTLNSVAFSNSASVVFTPFNRAPVASVDTYVVNNHEKLSANVLLNDNDPDGHELTVKTALVRQPMFGNVTMLSNGSFTYTPNKGYAGEDSFTYEACDNGNPALCAQASVNILVKQGLVFIPDGFSPDGDGENDMFVIYGAEEFKVSLKVFNRWGDIVYESREYRNDWNGTSSKGQLMGDKLPDGTYFYLVDLNNGEKPRTHSLIIKRK